VLPFVAGERAPGWRGDARAAINGLTLNTNAIDILRAGLEGVALRFALIYRSIAPYLPPEHHIIASGSGLLSSPTWMQIMADVLNRPVSASLEQEATSRGIALLALQALGQMDIPQVAIGQSYTPIAAHHTLYNAALEHQLVLYHKLID
jgi:gluconokinase